MGNAARAAALSDQVYGRDTDGGGFTVGDGEAALGELGGLFGSALAGHRAAHAAQARGEPEPWKAAASADALFGLDYLLPAGEAGFTLLGRIDAAIAADPAAASSPEVQELRNRALGIAAVVSTMQRPLLVAELVPHESHGRSMSLTAPPTAGMGLADATLAVIARYTPLVDAAVQAKALGDAAADAKGLAARDAAVLLVAGPLGQTPGSAELQYVDAAFRASAASADLRHQVDLLLGAEDRSEYGMVFDLGEDAVLDGLEASGGASTWATSPAMQGPARPGADRPGATHAAGGAAKLKESRIELETETRLTEMKAALSASPGELGASASAEHVRTQKGGHSKNHYEGGAEVTFGESVSGKVEGAFGRSNAEGASKNTGSLELDEEGRLIGESGVSTTTETEGGGSTTTAASARVGKDLVGGSASKTVTGADGTATTNAYGGQIDSASGTASAEMSTVTKSADGKVKSGASVAGSVTAHDGKLAGSGAVSVTQGKRTYKLGGDVSSDVSAPEDLGNGRWRVTVAFSMGATGGASTKGKNAGGGASASVRMLGTRTRLFDSEEEAKAFYANPTRDPAVTSAAEALAMREGETASQEEGIAGKIEASGKIGPATVGVGAEASTAGFTNLERKSGNVVRAEVGRKAMRGVSGSISAYGVGGGLGVGHDESQSVTVDFDLGNPMGKRAFELYVRTGQLPAVGGGFRIAGDSRSEADTNSRNLSILGLAMSGSRTTGSSLTNLDGKRTETNWGTDAVGVSVPLLGSYGESHTLTGWQVDEGENLYQTESVVKGSRLGDVRDGLSDGLYGHDGHGGASDKGSNKGTYRLQAAYSEAQIDRMIEMALGANGGKELGARSKSLDGLKSIDGLRSALRSAGGDRDQQRRALAAWTSQNGQGAMDLIHNVAGGGDSTIVGHGMDLDAGSQYFVAVDGNPHLTGLKGQLDLELRMRAWDERLAAGERGPGLAGAVRKDLDRQRAKLRYLEECGELPPKVHAQEYERTRRNLGMLDALFLRSLDGGAAGTAPGADPKLAALHTAVARVSAERARMQDYFEDAYYQRRNHVDGRSAVSGRRASRDFKHLQGPYDQIDAMFSDGQQARGMAEEAEKRAGAVDLKAADLLALAALNLKAAAEYRRAATKFYSCEQNYIKLTKAIREADPQLADAYFRYAGDLHVSMLPGQ